MNKRKKLPRKWKSLGANFNKNPRSPKDPKENQLNDRNPIFGHQITYWLLSARLQYHQCTGKGDTAVFAVSQHYDYTGTCHVSKTLLELHQPRLWFITGGYLVKRWFLPAAARARGQSNDLNREILASNLFNCRKGVINAPPVPSISRCIHIVYRHKNVWEYQWSNFIYDWMSTFLHYVRCKDALLDCSAPGGERCKSLTGVDEIRFGTKLCFHWVWLNSCVLKKYWPRFQIH